MSGEKLGRWIAGSNVISLPRIPRPDPSTAQPTSRSRFSNGFRSLAIVSARVERPLTRLSFDRSGFSLLFSLVGRALVVLTTVADSCQRPTVQAGPGDRSSFVHSFQTVPEKGSPFSRANVASPGTDCSPEEFRNQADPLSRVGAPIR